MLGSGSIIMLHELKAKGKSIRAIDSVKILWVFEKSISPVSVFLSILYLSIPYRFEKL